MEKTMSELGPRNVGELDDSLSMPSPLAIEVLGNLSGDLILLGVGGKMGPTLARMARRASDQAGQSRRIIGVSRFSDTRIRDQLAQWGVETIACDLLDDSEVDRLPEAPLVIYMTGMKFGASLNPALTWAMNCYAPALVCRKFRHSRIVAFSSGNVYGMVDAKSSGSRETDSLEPVGEYSMTVLGRERMFQYFGEQQQIPTALLRLNYATELRYGVLVDIARDVLAGNPIDISMPAVNVIWQGEANAMTLAALAQTQVPANIINLAGPEILRVRDVAERFGKLMNKPANLTGEEGPVAYLNDGSRGHQLLGSVQVSADQMIQWTADWVLRGGESLNRPTHFQVVSGKY
jgi:nucleoside-diphosphate-sugar epimerase